MEFHIGLGMMRCATVCAVPANIAGRNGRYLSRYFIVATGNPSVRCNTVEITHDHCVVNFFD